MGTEKDEVKAFELYLKAAEQGLDYAQYNIGICYEYGIGTEKDEYKALEWYQKSAEEEFSYAQYGLGRLYLTDGRNPQAKPVVR